MQLLGNEPHIDPMDRVKNDYFETITIVDPLELPELQMTTILPVHVESHFLQDFNQQAVRDWNLSVYWDVAVCNGKNDHNSNCSLVIWYPMLKMKTIPANRHVQIMLCLLHSSIVVGEHHKTAHCSSLKSINSLCRSKINKRENPQCDSVTLMSQVPIT